MVVAPDGRFEGSVSGGCVEGEVIAEAEDILADGKPKTLTFGVADETAWQVGLPCGGQIKVYLERLDSQNGPALLDRAIDARSSRRGLLVRTNLNDGAREFFERDDGKGDAEIAQHFASGESELQETPDGEVFLHALVPPARVLVIGATHIGQILAQLVKLAGYEVIVIDPRTAFAAEARFPGIRLDTEWPQDTIPKIGLDPYTAVVALAHVGHIDDEALKLAMRSALLLRRCAGIQAQPRQAHAAPQGRGLHGCGDRAHRLADRHQHRRAEPAGDRHRHHGGAGARAARRAAIQARLSRQAVSLVAT